MRARHVVLFILLAVALTSFSCSKRKDKAGKGGNATLRVTPQHHGQDVADCTVYLKYDSSVPPSDSTQGYDESVVCVMENGKPVAVFTSLRNGKYYIFGYGYDPAVAQNVKGGIPYEITQQNTVSVNVPVTEGD
jgi:hypothetical protein